MSDREREYKPLVTQHTKNNCNPTLLSRKWKLALAAFDVYREWAAEKGNAHAFFAIERATDCGASVCSETIFEHWQSIYECMCTFTCPLINMKFIKPKAFYVRRERGTYKAFLTATEEADIDTFGLYFSHYQRCEPTLQSSLAQLEDRFGQENIENYVTNKNVDFFANNWQILREHMLRFPAPGIDNTRLSETFDLDEKVMYPPLDVCGPNNSARDAGVSNKRWREIKEREEESRKRGEKDTVESFLEAQAIEPERTEVVTEEKAEVTAEEEIAVPEEEVVEEELPPAE